MASKQQKKGKDQVKIEKVAQLFDQSTTDSFSQSENIINVILEGVEKEIRTKQVLLKLPQYNIELLIRQGAETAQQGIRWHDKKLDDVFLNEDIEPVSIPTDNYQTDTKQIKTIMKMDKTMDQNVPSSPTKSAISRKYTKLSKSIKSIQGDKQLPAASTQQDDAISKLSQSKMKFSLTNTQQQFSIDKVELVQLREEDWKKQLQYNDDLQDLHLDSLRKFIMKKREFQDASKLSKGSKGRNLSLGFVAQNLKQTGLIFENGGFLKSKKVNGDALPLINYHDNEVVFQTQSEIVSAQQGIKYIQLKDTVSKLKVEYEKKKAIDQERQQQEEMIKNYEVNKKIVKKLTNQKLNKGGSNKQSALNNNNDQKDDNEDDEEDGGEQSKLKKFKHFTDIVTNEKELANYRTGKKIMPLIANAGEQILNEKHIARDFFKSQAGVTYLEQTQGSTQNLIKMEGRAFHEDPIFTNRMRKSDLIKKQNYEREDLINSYKSMGRTNFVDRLTTSFNIDTSRDQLSINQKSLNNTFNETIETDRAFMKISETHNNTNYTTKNHNNISIQLPSIQLNTSRNLSFTRRQNHDKINSIHNEAKTLLMIDEGIINTNRYNSLTKSFITPSSVSRNTINKKLKTNINTDVNNSFSYSIQPLSTISSNKNRRRIK